MNTIITKKASGENLEAFFCYKEIKQNKRLQRNRQKNTIGILICCAINTNISENMKYYVRITQYLQQIYYINGNL